MEATPSSPLTPCSSRKQFKRLSYLSACSSQMNRSIFNAKKPTAASLLTQKTVRLGHRLLMNYQTSIYTASQGGRNLGLAVAFCNRLHAIWYFEIVPIRQFITTYTEKELIFSGDLTVILAFFVFLRNQTRCRVPLWRFPFPQTTSRKD
jgi:hypothetical protein